ncbi:hypothetical protein JHK87_024914 [Glycine soja]|nr:hypothetical protein JHK87_024914 [Glycine soja]
MGVESVYVDIKDMKMIVLGDIDPVSAVSKLRKCCHTELVSVGPAKEDKEKEKDKPAKVLVPFKHYESGQRGSMPSKAMTSPSWGTDPWYLERWWCLRARLCGWGFLRGEGYLWIGICGCRVVETVVTGSRGGDVCSGIGYLGFGLGRRTSKKRTTLETKKKKRKRKRRMKDIATKNFQQICEAYEILSNPNKRQIYDIYGMEGLTSGLELGPKLNGAKEINAELERLKRMKEQEKVATERITSYPDIGEATFGKYGRIIVSVTTNHCVSNCQRLGSTGFASTLIALPLLVAMQE